MKSIEKYFLGKINVDKNNPGLCGEYCRARFNKCYKETESGSLLPVEGERSKRCTECIESENKATELIETLKREGYIIFTGQDGELRICKE